MYLFLFFSGLQDSINESATDVLGDFNILPSPSSPSNDKENGWPPGTPKDGKKTPGGSLSVRSYSIQRGGRRSPLKDIANVSRSLCFASPPKKAVTPSKKAPPPLQKHETSPADEPDANSRDSGYSESATKSEDGRSVAPSYRTLQFPVANILV